MDELTQILGFAPNPVLKKKILDDARTSGKPIGECAAAYQMPDLFIADSNGMIQVNGQRIKLEDYQANRYKRVIVIK
jgi:hypothetical protein